MSTLASGKLKFGVHTMMWGKRLTENRLKQMLLQIALIAKEYIHPKIGSDYEVGIEFAQKIHDLGYEIIDDEERAEMLKNIFVDQDFGQQNEDGLPKLVLLGFSGRGSLKKRIDFCESFLLNHGLVPKYFLIHQWCENYQSLLERANLLKVSYHEPGAKLALHPFRFGPVDKIRDFTKCLIEHPEIAFLPDTAHLWLANKRNLDWILNGVIDYIKSENGTVLDSWISNSGGIKPIRDYISVYHLKDWKKTYDSSLRYYSRGFSELGGGYISRHIDGKIVEDMRTSELGQFFRSLFAASQDQREEKWCVLEQDYTINDERESLRRSFQWLEAIIGEQPVIIDHEKKNEKMLIPTTLISNDKDLSINRNDFDTRKRQIISEIHQRTAESTKEFTQIIQDLFRYLFYAERTKNDITEDDIARPVFIGFWELSTRLSTMALINNTEKIGVLKANRSYEVKRDTCTGFRIWLLADLDTVENPEQHEFFDAYNVEIDVDTHHKVKFLTKNYTAKKRKISKHILQRAVQAGYDAVIWVPICNTYNFNQIEAGLDVFVKHDMLPILNGCHPREADYGKILEEYFDDLVRNIGFALEKTWGNVAYQTTNDLIAKVKNCNSSLEMIDVLGITIQSHFGLEDGYIEGTKFKSWQFFETLDESDMLKEIDPIAMTPLDELDRFNRSNTKNASCMAWRNADFFFKNEVIALSGAKGNQRSEFGFQDQPQAILSSIAFPLYGSVNHASRQDGFRKDIMGIFQCRSKTRVFSSSDENTIREMLSEFIPLFLNKLASERRSSSVRFIRHELSHTITALESLNAIIQKQMTFKKEYVPKPYKDEFESYIDLMKGILEGSFFISGDDVVMKRDSPVNLLAQILKPVANQGPRVIKELQGRNILKEIREDGAIRIARRPHDLDVTIYVDKSHFFQVFFNLLSNSIKYSLTDDVEVPLIRQNPDSAKAVQHCMQIDIIIERISPLDTEFPNGLLIRFIDYGCGVEKGYNESIFEDGFRAPYTPSDIEGEGIGLAVVRRVIQAHGGSITLHHNALPTEFHIKLPQDVFFPIREEEE